MKVVQINGVSHNGSTGKIVFQLSEVMKRCQIDNYIISSGYKEQRTEERIFFCSSYIGVRLHQCLGTLFGDTGFHSELATLKLIRRLEELKPDIVHIHNIYSYYLHVGILTKYLKNKNIITVWTLHDFWPITGHCVHFEAVECTKWKTRCVNCPQKHSYPYSRFFDCSDKLFKKKKSMFSDWNNLHLVGVSEWVTKNIAESFLKDKDIRVIRNGIDTKIFYPKSVEKPQKLRDKFIILSVAMSWSKNKGLDDLVQMSELLADDEILILIGLQDDVIETLPKKIIGLSHTETEEKLADWYNVADVCVSASVEETMGLTIAEAMACGTPAAVYNETALPELITDGCGVVCEKGAENLYRAVCTIRANGKSAYSKNCIFRVKENYNKDKQYIRYCQLYKHLINNNDLLETV